MAPCGLLPFADKCHRLLSALGSEVVQHDTVGNVGRQRFAYLVFVARLYLDTQVFAFLAAVVAGTGEGIGDTSGKVHMVVLQENHVEEPDTMVHAAANLHRLLLQIA